MLDAPPGVGAKPVLLGNILPHGPPLAMLRLLLTVRRIHEVSLRSTCARCNELRQGLSCGCPPSTASCVDDAAMDAELTADVTDGTGRAILRCSGQLVWILLQASDNTVNAVRRAVAASGPLNCKRTNGTFECLSAGRGQWYCGAPMNDGDKAALSTIWPTGAWQRQLVAHCMLGSRPPQPMQLKREAIKESAHSTSTLRTAKLLQLTACKLWPASAWFEAERARGSSAC